MWDGWGSKLRKSKKKVVGPHFLQDSGLRSHLLSERKWILRLQQRSGSLGFVIGSQKFAFLLAQFARIFRETIVHPRVGSTQATRFTAARQIGDIAKSHPQDLSSLLSKDGQKWGVYTRVAAAHAIGAIAGNVKHTTLTELYSCVETKMSEAGISGIVEDVVAWPNFDSKIVVSSSFRSFDINKEYDIASDNMKNPRECLARQKQNLRRQLGLDV
ncbi:hypothetical protein ACSBR2_036591 [Camellia fascicularis]